MNAAPLRLIAADAQDLDVVATMLQDAIVPACDMAFDAAEKTFFMAAQRFCWDQCLAQEIRPVPCEEGEDDPPPPCYARTTCAVTVRGVRAAQYIGIDVKKPCLLLDLLTISIDSDHLFFVFAGSGTVRLGVKDWRLTLEDFGESWPTRLRPRHPA